MNATDPAGLYLRRRGLKLSKPNPLYTVEAVELNEKSPAAKWVGEIAEADGIDPRTTRSVGDVLNIAQAVEDGNRGYNQAARGSFSPATLAIALANVRMACDRCEAIAQMIESGEAPRYDLELAEAMEQITLRARRVIDAGAVTPTVCRPVCRR
jgi:hypothetical protein